jgi:hypothetical protein
MRRALPLLLAALLALSAGAAAETQRLVFPTLLGEYQLAFDDKRTSEADVRALVTLSPHLAGWNSLAVAPRLERCVVDDPAYLDCRSRSPQSPNFLWNARVNLERGNNALAYLRGLRPPPELEPVVTWLTRSLTFSLWLEETKLEYLRSGDVAALRRRYEDVDPTRDCGEIIGEIARTSSADARFDLVVLRWHNCVNSQFRRKLGEYPLPAWKKFLSAWRINERVVESFPIGREDPQTR